MKSSPLKNFDFSFYFSPCFSDKDHKNRYYQSHKNAIDHSKTMINRGVNTFPIPKHSINQNKMKPINQQRFTAHIKDKRFFRFPEFCIIPTKD